LMKSRSLGVAGLKPPLVDCTTSVGRSCGSEYRINEATPRSRTLNPYCGSAWVEPKVESRPSASVRCYSARTLTRSSRLESAIYDADRRRDPALNDMLAALAIFRRPRTPPVEHRPSRSSEARLIGNQGRGATMSNARGS
jgi:hypothetical protein